MRLSSFVDAEDYRTLRGLFRNESRMGAVSLMKELGLSYTHGMEVGGPVPISTPGGASRGH